MPRPYELCVYIMEHSRSPYAVFEAVSTIKNAMLKCVRFILPAVPLRTRYCFLSCQFSSLVCFPSISIEIVYCFIFIFIDSLLLSVSDAIIIRGDDIFCMNMTNGVENGPSSMRPISTLWEKKCFNSYLPLARNWYVQSVDWRDVISRCFCFVLVCFVFCFCFFAPDNFPSFW